MNFEGPSGTTSNVAVFDTKGMSSSDIMRRVAGGLTQRLTVPGAGNNSAGAHSNTLYLFKLLGWFLTNLECIYNRK